MRFKFDTNVLVYAFDPNGGERHRRALDLVARARGRDLVLTFQALGELFRALVEPCRRLAKGVPIVAARLFFWDAMLWATAKANGCRVLISEDGQAGRQYGAVVIVDPFAEGRDPWLERALG